MRVLSCAISVLLMHFCTASMVYAHDESDIELDKVPTVVLETAMSARPGIQLQEAEKVEQNGKTYYEIEGDFKGKEIEILISEDGVLLETEVDDD